MEINCVQLERLIENNQKAKAILSCATALRMTVPDIDIDFEPLENAVCDYLVANDQILREAEKLSKT